MTDRPVAPLDLKPGDVFIGTFHELSEVLEAPRMFCGQVAVAYRKCGSGFTGKVQYQPTERVRIIDPE